MKKFLLPEGKGYKANLHCHTTLSDGHLTPCEVKQAYMAHGYQVVAFTDHEALCDHADLCDEDFVALNGYETAIKEEQISTAKRPAMKVHHLNLIKRRPGDLTQVCFYPENFTPGNCRERIPFVQYVGERCRYEYSPAFVSYLAAQAHENGFLVHYNHPRWSLQSAVEIAAIEGLDGLEVLNTGCRYQGDFDPSFYEEMMRLGRFPYVVAGDDNHNNADDPATLLYGGYTVIKAKQLTYTAITDALAGGDCYVSDGPQIHSIAVQDGHFIIRTSASSAITMHTEGRLAPTKVGEGGYIDAAAFPVLPDRYGSFVYFSVQDQQGRMAYTRAYTKAEWQE